MPRTRKDLVVRALGLLGVTEVGQDPSAEDVELVDGYVDGVADALAQKRAYYVQDIGAIDDAVFLPLAKLLANAAGAEFGQSYDPAVDLRQEAMLRDLQRAPPGPSSPHRGDYF